MPTPSVYTGLIRYCTVYELSTMCVRSLWPCDARLHNATIDWNKRLYKLPQRNSASAAHYYLGWLTDFVQFTKQCRCCTTKL